LAPVFAGSASSRQREAMLCALNGVLGDHLEATANPLAIPMQLRREGRPLELTREGLKGATGKVLLLVHGLCMNELQWRRKGHDPLAIPRARQWIGYGMSHLDLLDREEVYAQIKRWLCDAPWSSPSAAQEAVA
jgi:hypothetical protein